jgi:centromeric protein E
VQACDDVFAAIERTDHEFLLRISAMEIYNERVRDLLKDNTSHQNLPLLDDPERGTVVEGLSEEGICSSQHLQSLLSAVETRRVVRPTPSAPCYT